MRNSFTALAFCSTLLLGCHESSRVPEPEPQPTGPELTGAFLAGHLGNYSDCPGGGYLPGEDVETTVELPDNACGVGENCPFILCEDAMALIRLTNEGAACEPQVVELALFTVEGELRAKLPLTHVLDHSTAEDFGGQLGAGHDVLLRVGFQGPEHPYELLESENQLEGGILEIVVSSSDEDEDTTITSIELYPITQRQ